MRDLASVVRCGGLGFGLVRNHVWAEKMCLLITMSRMGYITICPNGKWGHIVPTYHWDILLCIPF